MSLAPAPAAPNETTNSGALVPKATTVRPTASSEIPSRIASADAPRTKASAPAQRSTSAKMISKYNTCHLTKQTAAR